MSHTANDFVAKALKPSKRWVVVASRSGARLFESPGGSGRRLRLIRDIPNPEGRLQDRELVSDRQGSVFAQGNRRHGYSQRETAHDTASGRFARVLANVLEDGRARALYDKLVLVAEPRFLGRLRGSVSRRTARLIAAIVDKELSGVRQVELERHLDEVNALRGG